MIFSIIGSSFAKADEVTLIDKGSPAPFKGYLFPEDKALKFKNELQELDRLKELVVSYDKSISLYKSNEELYNHKINVLLEQNNKLVDSIGKTEERDKWENRLWFILGMTVTAIGVYGAGQLK